MTCWRAARGDSLRRGGRGGIWFSRHLHISRPSRVVAQTDYMNTLIGVFIRVCYTHLSCGCPFKKYIVCLAIVHPAPSVRLRLLGAFRISEVLRAATPPLNYPARRAFSFNAHTTVALPSPLIGLGLLCRIVRHQWRRRTVGVFVWYRPVFLLRSDLCISLLLVPPETD